jgi:hypothetical protein
VAAQRHAADNSVRHTVDISRCDTSAQTSEFVRAAPSSWDTGGMQMCGLAWCYGGLK